MKAGGKKGSGLGPKAGGTAAGAGSTPRSSGSTSPGEGGDFIRDIVVQDLKSGKNGGRVHTRFPPEPNGYLHIGHAKSICLNFGIASEFGGLCNLRFDDTNPTKEEVEYVESIEQDVRWLGFDWADRLYYASDYFDRLYQFAVQLIRDGKAYVDDLTAEQIREYRGTLKEPGRNSPYRDRPVAENLDLFERMRRGEFPEGSRVLRARIDMASANINLRDPTIYRIRFASHHRTGGQVVHLPDVRLHPLPLGFPGGHHPLHLHPGVREQPPAVRLVPGPAPGALPPAADRVRPPQLKLYGLEQAQAAGAGAGGAGARLGRSAHAHPLGLAAAGLHPRVHPGLLRAHRGIQGQQHRGHRPAGVLPAGAPQQDRQAGHGRAAPPEADHRQLPRGPRWRSWKRRTIRRTRRPESAW